MTSASSTINSNATYTAETQAKTDTVTGSASSNLSSTDFLNLLLKQLQFQDPMSPTDNSQFVTQQCQFAQLSATTNMNDAISSNNAISEATSLVGKTVVLTDPDDSTKAIVGTVNSAVINGSSTGISVNGKVYSLSSLKYVVSDAAAKVLAADTGSTTASSTTTSGTTTTGGTTKTSG